MNNRIPFKACVYDIETSDLHAVGSGWLLCAVVMDLYNSQCRVFRFDEYRCGMAHETRMLVSLLDHLMSFQVWVGHNSDKFDWPYLKSRCSVLNVSIPRLGLPGLSYDTRKAFRRCGYRTVANCIGKPTTRLDHITDFFGIPQEKTALYPRERWEMIWGNKAARKAALDKEVNHCKRDVRMTRNNFWRLWEVDPHRQLMPLV